jgi:tryptophan-rich sensory protein
VRLGVRSTFGMLFLGFAAIFLLGEILALADPVGVQMSNDADPFGTPPGWRVHAVWFGVIAALSAAGGWLIFGGRPKRNTPTHPRHHG